MVRLAGFEPATFGSGDRRSSPAELQAHPVSGATSKAKGYHVQKRSVHRVPIRKVDIVLWSAVRGLTVGISSEPHVTFFDLGRPAGRGFAAASASSQETLSN